MKSTHLPFNGIQRTVEQWSLQKRALQDLEKHELSSNCTIAHNRIRFGISLSVGSIALYHFFRLSLSCLSLCAHLKCKYVSSSLFILLLAIHFLHTGFVFISETKEKKRCRSVKKVMCYCALCDGVIEWSRNHYFFCLSAVILLGILSAAVGSIDCNEQFSLHCHWGIFLAQF